jgi:hypothetical protein
VSSEAIGWVYRHSPYRGAAYAVHHAMADSANDQNGYLVWLANPKMAAKARCQIRSVVDAKAKLIADGFAELVDTQHGNGGGATYRMLFPDVPVVYDSTEGRRTHANRELVQTPTSANDDTDQCNPRHPLVQTTGTPPITNSMELNEPKARAPKQRRSQLSDDFTVTDAMRLWCTEKGIRSNPDSETPKFIDHHRSKGNVFADPVSAWRNWMRNADKYAASSPVATGNRSKSLSTVDRVLDQLGAGR